MSDKTLPPTNERLRQSREKGQLALSQDLVKCVKYGVLAESVFALEPVWRLHLSTLLDHASNGCSRTISTDHLVIIDCITARSLMWRDSALIVFWIICLTLIAGLVSTLATVAQTRLNFAPNALQNGMDKLNPGKNLQQLFSPQKLLMLIIGPIKAIIIFIVGYLGVYEHLPTLLQLYRLSLEQCWLQTIIILHDLERRLLWVMIILALSDYAIQYLIYIRGLRMSLDEVKRDYKQQEGDPHVKNKRKHIAKEVAFSESQHKAEKAGAVVVNPKHIAIAIGFDDFSRDLPQILVKCRDSDAQELRAFAAKRGIPVIRYVGLARRLYATAYEGARIPSDSLRAVALLYHAASELRQTSADHLLKTGEIFELDEEAAEAMLK